MNNVSTSYYFRLIHRYLGFFLAGIMAMYALSGIVLVFRNTDFLKKEYSYEKTFEQNLNQSQLKEKVKIKGFKVNKIDGDLMYFKEGTYNKSTGQASYAEKKLPLVLDKMTHLHKATTNDPLYYLNVFFGFSLLFFVISSFWMFLPSTKIFRKGLLFALAGMVLTFIMLFI